ncbi:MAG: VOC family protein [Roseiflexaceae bacterium]|nr:VOC family protein [Roseiflexaceae bacterium]
MSYQLDHLVILVHDLAQAHSDYTAQGFTVTLGGAHTDGATHNALISFAEGSYLELIAFLRDAPEHRWWRHTTAGEGLIDWALLPGNITAEIAAAHAVGLAYTGPDGGGRRRPDGQELRWQTGLAPSPDLPFLCADLTARSLRVPAGPAQQHANGATGIAEVVIAVADLAASAARYRALLGLPPTAPLESLKLGETILRLVGPGDSAVDAQLAARGEGPHALVVRGRELA